MKYIVTFLILLQMLFAQELKIKANSFSADQSKGISIFSGNVFVKRYSDELNASKVTVYTDKKNKPVKFIAVGNVSFKITTDKGSRYSGKAQKVIYMPKKQEYHFFKDVHLKQLDKKKEIIGEKVVLKSKDGKAYAEGIKTEPVIMIFDLGDTGDKK
jgi:lipopolysaccharide export system protein LptA